MLESSITIPKQKPEALDIIEKIKQVKKGLKNKIASIREILNAEHEIQFVEALEHEAVEVSKVSVVGGTALCAAGIALVLSGEFTPIMIGGSMIFAGGYKIKEELKPKLQEWLG